MNINVFTVILTTRFTRFADDHFGLCPYFLHFGIHFFIGLYLFNTATDHVYFWHACTLGPGLYSPNAFGDAALINYANLCKFSQNHIKCLMLQPIQFMFLMHIYSDLPTV